MNKVLSFIKNNASLTVMASLVVICVFSMRFQETKPTAKNLEVSAILLGVDGTTANFELTVKNADTSPFTYKKAIEATGMPSRHFKAEIATGNVVRTSLNKGWDELPFKIPEDQIFMTSKINDGLGNSNQVEIAPGATAGSTISLENMPHGGSTVVFTVDGGKKSQPLSVSVP